jgi:hypothetical protein
VAARTELPTRLLGAGLLGSALLMGVLAGVNPALAVGLMVGLVLLAIAMANLTAGICLLAFLTFLDTILPADAEGTLSVSKLVGLVLVLSWFALITAGERERREQIFSPPAFVFLLIVFVGWAAVSAVWAEDSGAAIDATTRYLPNAMLFLIVFAGVRTREQLLWVVGSLVPSSRPSTAWWQGPLRTTPGEWLSATPTKPRPRSWRAARLPRRSSSRCAASRCCDSSRQ